LELRIFESMKSSAKSGGEIDESGATLFLSRTRQGISTISKERPYWLTQLNERRAARTGMFPLLLSTLPAVGPNPLPLIPDPRTGGALAVFRTKRPGGSGHRFLETARHFSFRRLLGLPPDAVVLGKMARCAAIPARGPNETSNQTANHDIKYEIRTDKYNA
jgi:hypothetical protein